jgi:RNA polymerase sigma factor (sigma-70 family)
VRSSARHLRLAARAREVRIDVAPADDPAVRSEQREELVAAITRLSVDDRLVVALRWFEEMSECEMAEVLGVRPGTVKSRLNRAMTRLRSTLIREAPADE